MRVRGQIEVSAWPPQEDVPYRTAYQRQLVTMAGEQPAKLVSDRRNSGQHGRGGATLFRRHRCGILHGQ
jgi:hypothetical protein